MSEHMWVNELELRPSLHSCTAILWRALSCTGVVRFTVRVFCYSNYRVASSLSSALTFQLEESNLISLMSYIVHPPMLFLAVAVSHCSCFCYAINLSMYCFPVGEQYFESDTQLLQNISLTCMGLTFLFVQVALLSRMLHQYGSHAPTDFT